MHIYKILYLLLIINSIGCGHFQELTNAENCVLGRQILLKEHKNAGFENIFFPEELKIRLESFF